MPKITFFNLPEEKQAYLIQCIKKEFSRVPLNEASVANIVRAAKIPRGSFYQYFEDKEDAFYYILELLTNENKIRFISILEKTNGNIFETFVAIFKRLLMEFRDPENRHFFKNVFLNMNYKTESIFTEMFNESRLKKDFCEVSDLIDTTILNVEDNQEIIHVVQITVVLTVHHLMKNFAKDISVEDAVTNYEIEMNLLKRGLCRCGKPL